MAFYFFALSFPPCSTYSTLYNHPTWIVEARATDIPCGGAESGDGDIKLSKKTGIPLGVLPGPLPKENHPRRSECSLYNCFKGPIEFNMAIFPPVYILIYAGTITHLKDEHQDEKKTRKHAMKEDRKVEC